MDRPPIYLDYNATTPVDPAVAEAMLPYLYEHFGNPSSTHAYGVATKQAVERARAQVCRLIACEPEEILFTSGGSESNNMAIKGVASALHARGRHIVISAVEHPAVIEPCEALRAAGFHLTLVAVDAQGRVDPHAVARALTPETILVSIMHANNEIGTIQPIAEIAAAIRGHGAVLHTDAAQSVGKIPVDVGALGVDLLSIAGHKLYGPKGVGALAARKGLAMDVLVHGAPQENGRRGGTHNVASIVGFAAAAKLVRERMRQEAPRLAQLDRKSVV